MAHRLEGGPRQVFRERLPAHAIADDAVELGPHGPTRRGGPRRVELRRAGKGRSQRQENDDDRLSPRVIPTHMDSALARALERRVLSCADSVAILGLDRPPSDDAA
jgi:hypothetical protein